MAVLSQGPTIPKAPDADTLLAQAVELQQAGDMFGAVTNYDGDDTSFAATGHLNTKLGNGLIGGFAGVEASDDITVWGLGVEGQANINGKTSLYGQAGYGNVDDAFDADIWAVRGEVRHFVTDNFRLTGSLGYATVDVGPNVDTWNAGVEAEYQFAETPFSVVAGYDHFA